LFARLTRGQILAEREQVYVEAARSSGAGGTRIVLRHLLPNIASAIVIQFYLTVAYAILLEAILSFLGVGVQPPEPSWGSMLKTGYSYLGVAASVAVIPGAAIFLVVLGLALVGEAFLTMLDPRQARAAGPAT
jgi:peptide/nickel transport system permease protein